MTFYCEKKFFVALRKTLWQNFNDTMKYDKKLLRNT